MIFLIRHGEAAAGWGEHVDPGLSRLGAGQADAAARLLSEAGAQRAVSSPLQRCRETAAPLERMIATHARIEPGVGEIPTPKAVGDRTDWLKGIMAGQWSDAGPELDAWRQGVLAAVERISDNTAVFSHFVAINAVVGLLSNDDRCVVFRPGHCSITKLDRRGGKLVIVELGSESATRVL